MIIAEVEACGFDLPFADTGSNLWLHEFTSH